MADIKNSTPVVTAIAMSAPDVESQEPTSNVPKVMEDNTMADDDNAGKGMGIAIYVLIVVGLASGFFVPPLSSACMIAAIVLASILTCGCCCAKEYNLKPHVKNMATATLVALILLVIVDIIIAVILVTAITYEYTSIGMLSETSVNVGMLLPVSIVAYVLIGLTLVFSGIFTWGRKCGAPRV